MNKLRSGCLGFFILFVSSVVHGSPLAGFYAGISGGPGSTTWSGLVAAYNKRNSAILLSTPVAVKEGGTVFGVFGGYELTPNFAFEAFWTQYPDARISFSKYSLFAFKHNQRVWFDTSTETAGIMAKVMVAIPKTPFRFYSAAGVATVHREDEVLTETQISPTVGVGFLYNMTSHLMTQVGFTYTAGYGESELNPANIYVPFLYAGLFSVAFRF